eukprot:5905813-Prymnesium_polylepis.1
MLRKALLCVLGLSIVLNVYFVALRSSVPASPPIPPTVDKPAPAASSSVAVDKLTRRLGRSRPVQRRPARDEPLRESTAATSADASAADGAASDASTVRLTSAKKAAALQTTQQRKTALQLKHEAWYEKHFPKLSKKPGRQAVCVSMGGTALRSSARPCPWLTVSRALLRRFIASSELHAKVLSLQQRASEERGPRATPAAHGDAAVAARGGKGSHSDPAEWRDKVSLTRRHFDACRARAALATPNPVRERLTGPLVARCDGERGLTRRVCGDQGSDGGAEARGPRARRSGARAACRSDGRR